MDTSTQDHEPSTVAYVPRHLAVPDVPAGVDDVPVDPRSSRWDRSAGTLTRLLDELHNLEGDDVLAATG